MPMNKQKGNMYPWVTHTENIIRGDCIHECIYCYMERFPQGELRLDEGEFNTNLGENNTIFFGSSTDMWAEEIPSEWITKVLSYCRVFTENSYLFQTKNPRRFHEFIDDFPSDVILGVTLESNQDHGTTKAPSPKERMTAMVELDGFPKMVSIEPIEEFDVTTFVTWIRAIAPSFVSIGADSQGHKLPEPPGEKIGELIAHLQSFTEVKVKPNLKRLLGLYNTIV